jgi:hypothetical protein
MKTLAATRPALSAEVLARLITEAGVPCVTLVPNDEAAAAPPATPQDEGLRIVAGSMPVRIAYPIPDSDDDETRYWAALHRHDSHVLWLYDWVEQFRWSAHRDGPHADPWITISPDPRPDTFIRTSDGRECSRATGYPMEDEPPVRWLALTTIEDADALAAWIEADVAADIEAAGRLRASREYLGSFRLRDAARIRAAGPRAYCDHAYRHDNAQAEAQARARGLDEAGQPGIRHEAAPVTGYGSCITCLWPVFEAAGRWWHENGDCSGPRKIRDLPTEPGDWEFSAHTMICGYCGLSVSWKEVQMSWVRLTGVHSIGVQLKNTDTGYGAQGRPGDLVILAEVEGIAARPGELDFLPHYCTQIPAWIERQLAVRRRAALAGKPATPATLRAGSLS